MATWDAANPDYSNDEKRLGNLTDYLLGKKFPGINENVKRAFSLYRFIVSHTHLPAKTIQQSILENGKPLYSEQDIISILKTVNKQSGTPFAKHFIGGANPETTSQNNPPSANKVLTAGPVVTTPVIAKNASVPISAAAPMNTTAAVAPVATANVPAAITPVNTAVMPSASLSATSFVKPSNSPVGKSTTPQPQGALVGKDGKPEVDETRNEFFDKMFRKMMYNLPTIPKCFDGVMWYFFILYNLEQLDFIGPLLASILDTITLSLPVLAELSVEVISKLIGFIPVPYANLGGEAIGYAISLIFIMMAVSLNISRKHFGTAFKTSLEAIPVVGDTMFDAARSFEIGMKRYEVSKHKFLKSVDKISPSTEDFIDYYTPDSEIHPGPAPTLTVDEVKADIATYVKEATGLDKVENAVTNATQKIPNFSAGIPQMPGVPQLPQMPGVPQLPQVPGVPQLPQVHNTSKNITTTNSKVSNNSKKMNNSMSTRKNSNGLVHTKRNNATRKNKVAFSPTTVKNM